MKKEEEEKKKMEKVLKETQTLGKGQWVFDSELKGMRWLTEDQLEGSDLHLSKFNTERSKSTTHNRLDKVHTIAEKLKDHKERYVAPANKNARRRFSQAAKKLGDNTLFTDTQEAKVSNPQFSDLIFERGFDHSVV